MRRPIFIAVCCAIYPFLVHGDVEIPPYMKICRRNDPHLEICVKDSVQELVPHLSKGISKFGIKSADPMHIDKIEFSFGTGAVNARFSFLDLEAIGFKDITFTSASVDVPKYRFRFELKMPSFALIGNYVAKGNIILLPLDGSGQMNITVVELLAEWDIRGHEVRKDGKRYMEVDYFNMDFVAEGMYIYLENLFKADPSIGEATLAVLNENWDILLDEMKPVLQVEWNRRLLEMANGVFLSVPYNQLIPDN